MAQEPKTFSREELDALIKQAASYADSEGLVTLPINDANGNPLRLPAAQVEPFLRSFGISVGGQELTDQTMQGPQAANVGIAPIVYGNVVGGKATYDIPVGEGSLRVGASGGYTKMFGQPSKAAVGEYEASYGDADRRMGAAYNPNIEAGRLFYEQQLGDSGRAGISYMPKQGPMPSDQVQFFMQKNFSKGGEAMAQEPVTNLIRTEAQKQGVNPDLAIQIASVESGLNPAAQNPKSSASGLFQLIDRTRKQLGGDPKNKFDPLENVRLGVKLIKQNEGQLMTSLGRRPTDHELYMAHLFGPTGAVSLIQADPNIPVQKAVLGFSSPKTADAIVKNNRLTGTVGDVIGKFQQKFGGKPQTQQKTAPAKQKPAAPEGPVPFTTGFDFADLGPSYQAAFALASLGMLKAPTEGEEQKKKKVEVEEEPQQPSRSSQMLAGMKLPEPLAFAEGGSAEKAPAVVVTPEEKPKTEAKSMLDKLLKARKEATSTFPGMGADIAASTINPFYGAVAGAADFETARREGDLLNMALAGIGLIPGLGPALKGIGMKAAPIAMAMRPKGGVFLTSGKYGEVKQGNRADTFSKFDKDMSDILDMVDTKSRIAISGISQESADVIRELFDKKARKYFTTQFASVDDPLYDALKEGRIKPVGEPDKKLFRRYMVTKAREGDPEALEDLAFAYDKALQRSVFVPKGQGSYSTEAFNLSQRRKEEARALAEEQRAAKGKLIPEELRSMETYVERKDPISLYGANRALVEEGANVPPHIQRALSEGEMVYDISDFDVPKFMRPSEEMIDELAKINPAVLKKMNYPEAVAAVNREMRLSADWDDVVKLADSKGAKAVPKEMRSMFTQTVVPLDEGQKWVRLTDSKAAALEGKMMKHSVWGYDKKGQYGLGGKAAFDAGKAEVFSLRGPDDIPVLTIEVDKAISPGNGIVTQVKGLSNKHLEDLLPYADQLVSFFEKTGYVSATRDLPDEILQRVRKQVGKAKGGMVDKPLYS